MIKSNMMKNALLITNLFTFLIINPTFAVDELVSQIKNVTIFTQGAQVFRTKRVNLVKGENTLRFTQLELDLDANTIQLLTKDNNTAVTVISSRYYSESNNPASSSGQLRPLKDSIDYLSREISLISSKIEHLNNEKSIISSVKKVGEVNEATYVERLAELSKFQRERLNAISTEIYDLTVKKNQFSTLHDAVTSRFNEKAYPKSMGIIEAKIFAEMATTVDFDLNYMIRNVGWTPFYEIRSEGLTKPLNVVCKATITQNTGINWENVRITLSTRKPQTLSTIPVVHPWSLFFQDERHKYLKTNQLIDNRSISNSSYALSAPSNVENENTSQNPTLNLSDYLASYETATFNMINREYKNNRSYSLNGNNGLAVIELDAFEMTANYTYYTVPKYDPNVYLIAEINDWEKYNLIPAFGNLFLEGSYVGKLFVDPTKIEKNLQIMLGKTDDVTVQRRKIQQDKEKTKRIVNDILTTEIGIEILVKSTKNIPIQLIIKDQVPISTNDQIEVIVKDISKAEKDDATGTLTWGFELPPNKTVKHEIVYEIKQPKNRPIYGL